MPGLRLNEAFFTAVIQRAGGRRLKELYTPPEGKQNADYLFCGWVIELKNLLDDPLDAEDRQTKIARFIREEFPNPIWVTPTRRAIALDQRQHEIYWVRIMGSPIRRALEKAEEQIRDTRLFVPDSPPGLVILVNNNVSAWGWSGFVNLVATYWESFPAIDAVIAIEALPESPKSAKDYVLHIAVASKPGKAVPQKILDDITNSMNEEIFIRTRREPNLVMRDDLGPQAKVRFEFCEDGKFRMKP